MSRISDQAEGLQLKPSLSGRVNVQLFKIASLIALVYNTGIWCWALSISYIPVSDVTAIYNSSCFFAYLFAIFILKEQFKWKKLFAVVVSIMGIICIAVFSGHSDTSAKINPMGYVIAAVSSVFVGLYEVLYKKMAVPRVPSLMFSLHVTGLIGVATVLFGLIPFPIIHFTGFEIFQVPTMAELGFLSIIVLAGLLFNSAFMCLITFSGPVVAAVGIILTIPVITIFDAAFIVKAVPGWNSILGCCLILIGFCILAYADREAKDHVREINEQVDKEKQDSGFDHHDEKKMDEVKVRM